MPRGKPPCGIELQPYWYTTDEFAKIVGRSEFTCREWARHGPDQGPKAEQRQREILLVGDYLRRIATVPVRGVDSSEERTVTSYPARAGNPSNGRRKRAGRMPIQSVKMRTYPKAAVVLSPFWVRHRHHHLNVNGTRPNRTN